MRLPTNDEIKAFLINFCTAGITAGISKTLSAPFDRVKLILQNQQSVLQVLTGEREKYKGIVDCFVRLPKEQGFLSFWRGNTINIARYVPTQALNFSFNDFYKKRLTESIGVETGAKNATVKLLSGLIAGACSTSIMYPLEFCQTRIAVDVGSGKNVKNQNSTRIEREFNGLYDCLSKVCRSEGYTGVYKGFTIAVSGTAVYRTFYFGLFDEAKSLWAKESSNAKPPIYISFMMAQSVTIFSGMLSYPLDTVGRRLMMEAGRPVELRLFKNARGAFKHIYKNEGGVRAFYGGLVANCLRSVSGALVLVFYDEISDHLKNS